ncbi:MAG: 50S ribosomal protein L6 [Flavobacteriales bacterium]|jgi:large subunit ribosomal protein L6|nr:50S ribosomal protein L6 [Flavobacteriales bacterium]MDG2086592.1 50S ribosomal protein L6 [Flavobacteriales bacterium]|tara:strand:+ start:186 stop:737 length:552 start_codon:yes stop_codon:yes gene_type:complete
MSRIGNNPITVPETVNVSLQGSEIIVKGKLGELSQTIDSSISVSVNENIISLSRQSDNKDVRSKHGLYRALISNMIEGVNNGHTKKLELRGVGYRASTQGKKLDISVGYSHNIIFDIPEEVKVTAETEKGKAPIVTISGHDKQLVGAIAARIRAERKPEPYKGKGIRYVDEYVRKKAGKTAAK